MTNPKKGRTKTIRAIKSACSALKKDFSNGTNNMAEAWVNNNSSHKGQKVKKLKDGTVSMAKNMAINLKESLKGINANTVVCDISFELGGALQKTKDVLNEYIEDFTKLPKRTSHGK